MSDALSTPPAVDTGAPPDTCCGEDMVIDFGDATSTVWVCRGCEREVEVPNA